jgi:hypothetical protein
MKIQPTQSNAQSKQSINIQLFVKIVNRCTVIETTKGTGWPLGCVRLGWLENVASCPSMKTPPTQSNAQSK